MYFLLAISLRMCKEGREGARYIIKLRRQRVKVKGKYLREAATTESLVCLVVVIFS